MIYHNRHEQAYHYTTNASCLYFFLLSVLSKIKLYAFLLQISFTWLSSPRGWYHVWTLWFSCSRRLLNYFVFPICWLREEGGGTCWRLFQKRIVCNELDIYICLFLFPLYVYKQCMLSIKGNQLYISIIFATNSCYGNPNIIYSNCVCRVSKTR